MLRALVGRTVEAAKSARSQYRYRKGLTNPYTKGPGFAAPFKKIAWPALAISGSVYASGYSQKYGTGAALLHGVATSIPYVGGAILLGEAGVAAMDYGYQKYHERRTLNMGQPRMDPYGTQNAMRMNSLQKMQRGHNSVSKVVGNEARYLHS